MMTHVSRENKTNNSFSENFVLISRESFDKIILIFGKDPKKFGRMKMFLHRNVIAINGPLRHNIHMIRIGKSIMAQVMTDGCC